MGILPEVISRRALEASHKDGEDRHRSELVTLYIKEHPERFRIVRAPLPADLYRPRYRLTVDEPEDAMLLDRVFQRLYKPGLILETREAIRLLDAEPSLREVNAHLLHKAANIRSVALDAPSSAEEGNLDA
jgi:spore coat polysaccharide biosynthesis protein SpsF